MSTNFAHVWSAQTALLHARRISVEVDISRNTLQKFTIVGLPDKAVAESRDRVSAALKNSGYTSPKSRNDKVVVSLAPADLKKEGPVFDLAIALAYLKAFGEIAFDSSGKLFLGELSLLGEVRPLRGVVALVLEAKRLGFTEVFLPKENAEEAALVPDITVYGVETLREVILHVREFSEDTLNGNTFSITPTSRTEIVYQKPFSAVSLEDIKGQQSAKRGLVIAAAGGHNVILYGPPGTGKTMLARALSSILPPLSFSESIEVTTIHSIAGILNQPIITAPPFRAPHHTASHISLVGGGTIPKPGEVTLAHRGVLFADEFPEFDRRVIEALREPLEEHVVTISRAKGSATFPANFIFVAAMNPCPCGNFGSQKECVCTPNVLTRYHERLSGPITDRIDLWIQVSHIPHDRLLLKVESDETKHAEECVLRARAIQRERFKDPDCNAYTNAGMNARALTRLITLDTSAKRTLLAAARTFDLSPRSYHRLVKLARTIADLDEADIVREPHIMEALQYKIRLATK